MPFHLNKNKQTKNAEQTGKSTILFESIDRENAGQIIALKTEEPHRQAQRVAAQLTRNSGVESARGTRARVGKPEL